MLDASVRSTEEDHNMFQVVHQSFGLKSVYSNPRFCFLELHQHCHPDVWRFFRQSSTYGTIAKKRTGTNRTQLRPVEWSKHHKIHQPCLKNCLQQSPFSWRVLSGQLWNPMWTYQVWLLMQFLFAFLVNHFLEGKSMTIRSTFLLNRVVKSNLERFRTYSPAVLWLNPT